jgi:L-ascorbate metabolism protein UlaG (beta-lactamase superfamily)
MIGARRALFGAGIIDPRSGEPHDDVLAIVWLGVSTFMVALAGRVLLFDAWIPRGTSRPRTPFTPADLAYLRPDAVLVGHGHFDHAADLAEVLRGCDATLIATEQLSSRCSGCGGARVAAASLPGEVRPLAGVFEGLEVVTVGHVHSALRLPTEGLRPLLPLPDPATIIRNPPRLRDAFHLGRHLPDRAGTSVLYQLRGPSFTLVWHDTSGPLDAVASGTLAALPPSDVHLGAIMGFGQLTNGLRDPRRYIEALRPSVFVPHHHDDWLPPFTAPGDRYRAPLERELGRLPGTARPDLRFITDPHDYGRPIVWRS